jgi:hypothetical protein
MMRPSFTSIQNKNQYYSSAYFIFSFCIGADNTRHPQLNGTAATFPHLIRS